MVDRLKFRDNRPLAPDPPAGRTGWPNRSVESISLPTLRLQVPRSIETTGGSDAGGRLAHPGCSLPHSSAVGVQGPLWIRRGLPAAEPDRVLLAESIDFEVEFHVNDGMLCEPSLLSRDRPGRAPRLR